MAESPVEFIDGAIESARACIEKYQRHQEVERALDPETGGNAHVYDPMIERKQRDIEQLLQAREALVKHAQSSEPQ